MTRAERQADAQRRGTLIAALLSGAWRECPPEPALSGSELADVTPLLQQSGAAPLGWWAVRHSALRDAPAASELRRSYRFEAVRATVHERNVMRIFEILRSGGVEPLLAKGWAAARFYPEPALRPYDDVDLLVWPGKHAKAKEALKAAASEAIDLHKHFADLADRSVDALYERSVLLPLGDAQVRVLGAEDHLRLMCQHLLRHGCWRPGWLADVGAALESRPDKFDWAYCLGGDPRRSEWVRCALALAERLLGARLPPELESGATRLPDWLAPTIWAEWGRREPHRSPAPLDVVWRRPGSRQIVEELRCRWPNPIVATVFCHAAFAPAPRLPLQVANYVASAGLAALGRTPDQS